MDDAEKKARETVESAIYADYEVPDERYATRFRALDAYAAAIREPLESRLEAYETAVREFLAVRDSSGVVPAGYGDDIDAYYAAEDRLRDLSGQPGEAS